MSETITIKKKKKKIFDYTEAVKILRPMIVKWKDLDEQVAKKIHEYYIMPECRFNKLCELLDVHHSTMYALFDKYDLPRKHEAVQESALNRDVSSDYSQELEPAIVDDTLQSEIDDRQFKETYSIIKNAQSLNKSMFNVPERQELIEELQTAVKHLTTLLLKLESNIED